MLSAIYEAIGPVNTIVLSCICFFIGSEAVAYVKAKVHSLFEVNKITTSISQTEEMNKTLTILRDRTGAVRTQVHYFHNGDRYFSGNPILKMSCVAEDTAPGSEKYISNAQNIKLETIQEAVSFLSDTNEREIKHLNIERLDSCYFKTSMTYIGVKEVFISPIMKHGRVFGLIMIHYGSHQTPDKEFVAEQIAELGSAINYNLGKSLGKTSILSRILKRS